MVGKNGAIYVSFFLSQSLCGESEVAVEKYIKQFAQNTIFANFHRSGTATTIVLCFSALKIVSDWMR